MGIPRHVLRFLIESRIAKGSEVWKNISHDFQSCRRSERAVSKVTREALKPEEFHAPEAGRVVRAPGGYFAFVPAPLPPKISYTDEIVLALSRADSALC